eukprot:6819559-Prymnesium_polylepis.1
MTVAPLPGGHAIAIKSEAEVRVSLGAADDPPGKTYCAPPHLIAEDEEIPTAWETSVMVSPGPAVCGCRLSSVQAPKRSPFSSNWTKPLTPSNV